MNQKAVDSVTPYMLERFLWLSFLVTAVLMNVMSDAATKFKKWDTQWSVFYALSIDSYGHTVL